MIVASHGVQQLRSADSASRRAVVWGMSAAQLHDRFWATRNVQVVRCGAEEAVSRGPSVYLLLGRRDLVIFSMSRALRKLEWLKPRALRVRLREQAPDSYKETIGSGPDGSFLGVRRRYETVAHAAVRPVLTTERALAREWARAAGSREAWRKLRGATGPSERAVVVEPGRSFDAEETEEMAEAGGCVLELLASWKGVGAALPGVYEFAPGVWAHESSTIEEGAVLHAPCWVGAGAHVGRGQRLVGPAVAPDERELEIPAIDWQSLGASAIRKLPGRVGGGVYEVSKRAFDIVFSLAALLATAPLYPVVIAAIFIEDGWPPFFAHRRQTRGGREFPCIKFRTMRRNAEEIKLQLASQNACDGPQFFMEEDPRLTRVGKVLRRFQIDELPQFINVLLGHMSVVGPRPSPDGENQCCPTWREARLSVRPGLTGLWQVQRTRAPETDFQEWIMYDLEYVKRRGFAFDLAILLETIKRVLRG